MHYISQTHKWTQILWQPQRLCSKKYSRYVACIKSIIINSCLYINSEQLFHKCPKQNWHSTTYVDL